MAPAVPPLVSSPELVEAELFLRRMSTSDGRWSGRNKAVTVTARGGRGTVDCIVKMRAGLENPSMAPLPYLCEWLAAALAHHLGVRAAAPYEVIITREFAESIDDLAVKTIALSSLGSTFGSGFVGAPFTQLTADLPSAGTPRLLLNFV